MNIGDPKLDKRLRDSARRLVNMLPDGLPLIGPRGRRFRFCDPHKLCFSQVA